jgi:hypothetical protein
MMNQRRIDARIDGNRSDRGVVDSIGGKQLSRTGKD